MASSDLSTESSLRLLEMGGIRFPSGIKIDEDEIDETDILQLMEHNVREFIKTVPPKRFHEDGSTLYKEVSIIIDRFVCSKKSSFLALWNLALIKFQEAPFREHIAKIQSVMKNKTFHTRITVELKTPAKHKSLLKRVLNIGSEFESLFETTGLTTTEVAQKKHLLECEEKVCTTLDAMLETENFSKEEHSIVTSFYKVIRQLHTPTLRNRYYNLILIKLVKVLTPLKTVPIPLTNILVQFYSYVRSEELIQYVDPKVTAYLTAHPIDFFTYQVKHLSKKLQPHSNFKKEGFRLDMWQRNALRAIQRKANLLMSAPTSAGKTVLSAYAINTYQKILYIVPSDALGYQLAGILLETLMENEKRIGSVKRNIRLELGSTSYTRISTLKDDIIVATPQQMWMLIQRKEITLPQDYMILDEFHSILYEEMGLYYEYLLYYAAFHKIPLMALSATIPNFEMVQEWFERILPGELFLVNEHKRFFNQKRMTFKVNHSGIELVTINPLQHMNEEVLRTSTKIGLHPEEVLSLYERLSAFPRIDEKTPRLVHLDEVERLEQSLISYLKEKEDISDIICDKPIESDLLTPYQFYKMLRSVGSFNPMLIFKMDSTKCLSLFQTLIHLIRDYNKLVYGHFNGDQRIIGEYLEDAKKEEQATITVAEDDDAAELEEKREHRKEVLFHSKYASRLQIFYDEYLETPIVESDRIEFNETYGADITNDFIMKIRKEHADKEKRVRYDTIRRRSGYTIHAGAKISSHSDGTIMREIRRQVNTELEYQYSLRGSFPTMSEEFSEFDIEENRISYEHPVMIGIECGFLLYNNLINPAMLRICQKLINKHPLIVLSDHSLAMGVNYPIKTVMLLGALKGEPIEEIDNTLAHQAMGRAGRRGHDSEGIVIYSGVKITNILTPQYRPLTRNDPAQMATILTEDSADFQFFVQTEVRPVVLKTVAAPTAPAAVAAVAVATTPAPAATAVLETKEEWEDYEC